MGSFLIITWGSSCVALHSYLLFLFVILLLLSLFLSFILSFYIVLLPTDLFIFSFLDFFFFQSACLYEACVVRITSSFHTKSAFLEPETIPNDFS